MPDVMLLDLNLPKADGVTILSTFRRHPECAYTPVIVVTSSDAERDRSKVAAFGVVRYFRKPSDFDAFLQLGALVREVVAVPETSGQNSASSGGLGTDK